MMPNSHKTVRGWVGLGREAEEEDGESVGEREVCATTQFLFLSLIAWLPLSPPRLLAPNQGNVDQD